MAIKHICVMTSKTYGGSYGVGDTKDEAWSRARSNLNGNPKEATYYEVDVAEGRKRCWAPDLV